MAEPVRLSEASRAAIEALAKFDYAALELLSSRLQAVVRGEIPMEFESSELVENNQKMLAGVLMATEQNLGLLQRLRERRVGNEWAL